MKRGFVVFLLLAFLVLGACSGDSGKPVQHKTKREVVETYPNGKLKKERIIDLDTHEYTEIEYYPSGKKLMEGKFTPNHKRTGKWMSWFENGKIRSIAFFKNGKNDGKLIVYREDGRLFYEGFYRQGMKEGLWRVYNDSGKLGVEVRYALDTIVYKKTYFKP
jgi:antitoxin component YwqK of YwqJK toxin-antitoxin module